MNAKSRIADMAVDMTEAASSNMAEGIATGQAQIEQAQTQVKHGMDKAIRGAEDMVAFGQGNVEALVKSSQVWVAGMQDLSKQVAATAQTSMEETMATLKALASIRSIKDAFELQANYTRAAMEKAMAETGKLTDASFKLAEQATAPLTARMTLAVEKFGKVG